MGLPMKSPADRRNRVAPHRGEWVDLKPLEAPVLEPYPAAWSRRGAGAIPRWLWEIWRTDPVTSQWSPGDRALALEMGASYQRLTPELRLRMQTMLGLNASGRRTLRWRNAAETESQEQANQHAAEARRLRIVADKEKR